MFTHGVFFASYPIFALQDGRSRPVPCFLLDSTPLHSFFFLSFSWSCSSEPNPLLILVGDDQYFLINSILLSHSTLSTPHINATHTHTHTLTCCIYIYEFEDQIFILYLQNIKQIQYTCFIISNNNMHLSDWSILLCLQERKKILFICIYNTYILIPFYKYK